MIRALTLVAIASLVGAFALPARATALATMQVVAGTKIAAFADRIAHGLVDSGERTIAPAFPIVDQDVPRGEITLAPGGAPIVNASYVSVPIAIDVDGRAARTVVAGYRVTSYVKTAVAARDLAAGAILGERDLAIARVPANGRTPVGVEMLAGRKVRVATARGSIIYPEQTATNELVHAGDGVVLVVRDGVVALNADVVARTSGGLGDRVAVYNPLTRTALSGTVTGAQRVELVLPGGE